MGGCPESHYNKLSPLSPPLERMGELACLMDPRIREDDEMKRKIVPFLLHYSLFPFSFLYFFLLTFYC